MNKKTFLITLLALVIVIVAGKLLYDRFAGGKAPSNLQGNYPVNTSSTSPSSTAETPPVEQENPMFIDFTATTFDGDQVNLSDYIGTPIVLNFWASWCGPCQMEMPHFQAAYDTYEKEELIVLMVNMTDGMREKPESAKAFITEEGYTFPVLLDDKQEAAMQYGVYSLPTTLFIDKDGKIVAQATGAIDSNTLQQGIDMILSSEK